MTINELVDAVVVVLKAGSTTQLALAQVYKGEQDSSRATRSVCVLWLGAGELPMAIGDVFADTHRVMLICRMPLRDPATTSPTAAGTWYGYFLDLCQEVRDLFSTAANRSLTAGGEKTYKAAIVEDSAGFDAAAEEEWLAYSLTIVWHGPQD